MIDKICSKITDQLYKFDGMPEKDVIYYSLKFIMTNVITFLLILGVGFATNNIFDVLLAALSFSLLRIFSGGYHIKNPDLCIIVSLSIVYFIANLTHYISNENIMILGIMSFILVIIYAPSNIEEHSILPKNKHFVFKIISIVIITIGFISKNDIIQVSFFIQSLTLVRFRLKGGELYE